MVKLLIRFSVREGIVKFEFRVINELCNAINLVFGLVDSDVRIGNRDAINVTTRELMRKDGPLLDADTNLQLVCWDML